MADAAKSGEPTFAEVALDRLRVERYRAGGIDRAHVRALAETFERWPPILVDRAGLAVIDGAHRVCAARDLGHRSVRCEFFTGTSDDARLEFLRRNTSTGLPLTLNDRRKAAATVLASHPDWSDRRIAELCGLSPHTVRVQRGQVGRPDRPSERNARLDGRIGRDGRTRPVDRGLLRAKIASELEASPDRSLRAIAFATGASPETVRSVKREMEARTVASPPPSVERLGLTPDWNGDSALRSMDDGGFLQWLDRTDLRKEHMAYAECVPLSRVYELAREARRRAAVWEEFAVALEARVSRRARLAM